MISDPEFTNAIERVEHFYQVHLARPARDTHADPLAYGRWGTDYYTLRAAGRDHESAIREVERRIAAVAGLPDPWPPPPAPPRPLQPLQGVLRVAAGQNAYEDDTGPVLPCFCHLGDGFSRYTRDQDGVLRLLDDIAAAGYHGVRFWTYLTGPYWAGREVDAGRQPDQFQAFGQELVARGLQAVVSQGDLWQANSSTRERLYGAILTAFPREAIAFVDAGNEVPNNGGASPQDCAAWINGLPGVKSLSTSQSEEKADLTAWSRHPAEVWDEHGYRGGRWWDKLRHQFSLSYEGRPDDRRLGIQSEPYGAGSRVSVTENTHELTDDVMAFAGALSLMARQAYVWFSGPGIISDESERLQDMPGFRSVPQLAAKLPRDVMAFGRLVHGGASQGGARVFGVTDEGGAQTTRCDQAIGPGDRFVAAIYGPQPRYQALQTYDTFEDVTLQNGQLRLVVGQVR